MYNKFTMPDQPPTKRNHICDICGKSGKWSPSWNWFGSLLDEEDGVVLKTCATECRQKVDAVGGPESALAGLRETRGLPAHRKGKHKSR